MVSADRGDPFQSRQGIGCAAVNVDNKQEDLVDIRQGDNVVVCRILLQDGSVGGEGGVGVTQRLRVFLGGVGDRGVLARRWSFKKASERWSAQKRPLFF